MKKRYVIPLYLSLTASVLAQTPFTTPPGFLSKEGGNGFENGVSNRFGTWRDARYQYLDGHIKAQGVALLTSVWVRGDIVVSPTRPNIGRAWNNVTLTLAAGDYTRFGKTFSSNSLSTPTRVFSGSVAWPSVTTTRWTPPRPWRSPLRFSFGSTYVSPGRTDLVLDFSFAGGAMANNASWGGATAHPYWLDGIHRLQKKAFGFAFVGTGIWAPCRDPLIGHSVRAMTALQVELHSSYSTSKYRGQAVAKVTSAFTAPLGAPVINVLDFNGSTSGINIGARCNNLMLPAGPTSFYFFGKTGHTPFGVRTFTLPLGTVAALAPLGKSVTLWAQSAWSDSSTSQLSLTTAARSNPDFGASTNFPFTRRRSLYTPSPANATGTLDSTEDPYPIMRYN